MTNRIYKYLFSLILIALLAMPPSLAHGQSTQLSLSVTPPLIQLSLAPGQTWSSSLKVVNANDYALPLYASMAVLEPNGDEGQSKFTPVVEGDEGNTLANWVTLGQTNFTVTREKSYDLPFTITVPKNAPPGGHYAAIIVGSQPLNEQVDGPTLSVSSSISSLLFLRVAGEVVELGDIREFTTGKTFHARPEVNFVLRFENKGNVHIQPQGDITVYNMWGKQRGVIPINHKTRFGNVLPKSVRKFEFEWKGAWNPLEFGRYKAVAVLTYGSDQKQNVQSIRYFWVIPVKETALALGSLLVFTLFFFWAVRRYIRRSLAIEAQRLTGRPAIRPRTKVAASAIAKRNAKATAKVAAMVPTGRSGLRGLMALLLRPARAALSEGGFFATIRRYPLFYMSLLIIVVGLVGIILYFTQVLQGSRSFDVEIKKPDHNNVILKNGEPATPPASSTASQGAIPQPEAADSEQSRAASVPIIVLNGTGTTGLAGKVAAELKAQGFTIARTGNSARQSQTVIQYHPQDESSAKALNRAINQQAEMSADGSTPGQITLIIGSNYQ